MAELLSFKHMYTVEYRPGEDELINYRAYRRKRAIACEETDVEEALTVQQRMARKRHMKKIKFKIKRGREIAKRRIASKEKLMKRTRRQVRLAFMKRFTKDIPKRELTFARRQEIEKRLEKPAIKKRIDMLARKAYPKVRAAELERKRKSRNAKK